MAHQRILATGGAGFLGSHVVGLLPASGRHVVVFDDLPNGKRARLEPARNDSDPEITDDRAGLTGEWPRRPGFDVTIEHVFETFMGTKQPMRERGGA